MWATITRLSHLTARCRRLFFVRRNSIVNRHLISNRKILISHMEQANFNPNSRKYTYEDALSALDSLLSNAAVLKMSIHKANREENNLSNTLTFLERVGIRPEDIDRLNAIHVTGTKGKGSTCAFTESILRQNGYKTGFFSSPHLISPRERIRLNGLPLSKSQFSDYFWDIYSKLEETQTENLAMPAYFMFFTVMAFYVFLKEKVDVSLIEVGIGGRYDCTNVLRSPLVTAITSLGLDHCGLLGDTVDKIAHQKAGIFKPNVPAYTVQQPKDAMIVLQKVAVDVGCSLYICPPLELHNWETVPEKLEMSGVAPRNNAALALQICRTFMKIGNDNIGNTNMWSCEHENSHYLSPISASTFTVPKSFTDGLENCSWPGRYQILHRGKTTFYLDGAHTSESMQFCATWFKNNLTSKELIKDQKFVNILLFYCTGERKPETLLLPLVPLNFDYVLLSPSTVFENSSSVNPLVDSCKNIWQFLNSTSDETKPKDQNSNKTCITFSCVSDVLNWIFQFNNKGLNGMQEVSNIRILVTGSLHLVGGVLSVIDPDLTSK